MKDDQRSTREERRAAGGCTCRSFRVAPDSQGAHRPIDPDCGYHALAAKYPDDHSIPWNCPNFWDGCNCKEPK